MKCMTLLILFSCALLSAVSVYDYFEQPSPEQILQYHQDKQKHPERYNYNPLQVGNLWFYSGWSAGPNGDEDIPYHLGRSVTADSLFEGIMHYYVSRGDIWENCWEYNSGDSVYVYHNIANYPNVEYAHELMYVFTPGIEFYPFWTWSPTSPVTCPEASPINIFGQTVNAVFINFGVNIETLWAEGFGPVYSTFDFGAICLAGAVINGVTYGYVPNQDEHLPVVNSLQLSCYPNPFSDHVNVEVKGAANSATEISIYNLKGQLIQSWNVLKTSALTWDGNSANGSPVRPGIYLVKAVNGASETVSKVIKID